MKPTMALFGYDGTPAATPPPEAENAAEAAAAFRAQIPDAGTARFDFGGGILALTLTRVGRTAAFLMLTRTEGAAPAVVAVAVFMPRLDRAEDAGALGMMTGDDGGGKNAWLYAMLAADPRPLAAVFAVEPAGVGTIAKAVLALAADGFFGLFDAKPAALAN